MDEQKNIKLEDFNAKKEEPKVKTLEDFDKPTLVKIVKQQNAIMEQMQRDLQDKRGEYIFSRIDILFRVLDHEDSFSGRFVSNCATELEELITIKKDKDEQTQKG